MICNTSYAIARLNEVTLHPFFHPVVFVIISMISFYYLFLQSIVHEKLKLLLSEPLRCIWDSKSIRIRNWDITAYDPYRWLMDQTWYTYRWLNEQRDLYNFYKIKLDDTKQAISFKEHLDDLNHYEQFVEPFVKGNNFLFYMKKEPHEEYVILWCKNLITQNIKTVLNMSDCKQNEKIEGIWISPDATYCTYAIVNKIDPTLRELKIKHIPSNDNLSDILITSNYGSISWKSDSDGFFYTSTVRSRELINASGNSKNIIETTDAPKIYYHKLGLSQDIDTIVYHGNESPLKKSWIYGTQVTPDEQFLLVEILEHRGSKCNTIYVVDISRFDGRNSNSIGRTYTLINTFKASFEYITNIGSEFWFKTNLRAPRYRVVKVTSIGIVDERNADYTNNNSSSSSNNSSANNSQSNLQDHNHNNNNKYKYNSSLLDGNSIMETLNDTEDLVCIEWIQEDSLAVLLDVQLLGYSSLKVMVLHYIRNGVHELVLMNLLGSIDTDIDMDWDNDTIDIYSNPDQEVYSLSIVRDYSTRTCYRPPSIMTSKLIPNYVSGHISSMSIQSDNSATTFAFLHTTYTQPGEIITCIVNKDSHDHLQCHLNCEMKSRICNFSSESLHCLRLLVSSEDNVLVPMTVIGRTETGHEIRPKPCILYSHGGFGKSCLPDYSPAHVAFILEHDAIVCILNNRGGGENGFEWHDQGRLSNKQMAANDLICAAQFLIQENFTSPHLLGLHGVGCGGLVSAICVNQRPELFRTMVCERGIFDLLRFEDYPIDSHIPVSTWTQISWWFRYHWVKWIERTPFFVPDVTGPIIKRMKNNHSSSSSSSGDSDSNTDNNSNNNNDNNNNSDSNNNDNYNKNDTNGNLGRVLSESNLAAHSQSESTDTRRGILASLNSQGSTSSESGTSETSSGTDGTQSSRELHNPLRFHKKLKNLHWSTWHHEFGYPKQFRNDFRSNVLLSPLHNVGDLTTYPSVLLSVGEFDRSVPPQHSYRYLAHLQNKLRSKQDNNRPILIRYESIDEQSDPCNCVYQRTIDVFNFFSSELASE